MGATMGILRDMQKGWRIRFTEGVYNLKGKVGQMGIICRGGKMIVKRVR